MDLKRQAQLIELPPTSVATGAWETARRRVRRRRAGVVGGAALAAGGTALVLSSWGGTPEPMPAEPPAGALVVTLPDGTRVAFDPASAEVECATDGTTGTVLTARLPSASEPATEMVFRVESDLLEDAYSVNLPESGPVGEATVTVTDLGSGAGFGSSDPGATGYLDLAGGCGRSPRLSVTPHDVTLAGGSGLARLTGSFRSDTRR